VIVDGDIGDADPLRQQGMLTLARDIHKRRLRQANLGDEHADEHANGKQSKNTKFSHKTLLLIRSVVISTSQADFGPESHSACGSKHDSIDERGVSALAARDGRYCRGDEFRISIEGCHHE